MTILIRFRLSVVTFNFNKMSKITNQELHNTALDKVLWFARAAKTTSVYKAARNNLMVVEFREGENKGERGVIKMFKYRASEHDPLFKVSREHVDEHGAESHYVLYELDPNKSTSKSKSKSTSKKDDKGDDSKKSKSVSI